MLKNILIYAVIIALLGVLYASTSRSTMENISRTRADVDDWWGIYKGVNGDLSNMAYLDFVRDFKNDDDNLQCPTKNGGNNIELYLRGDSYSRSISPKAYSFLTHFFFSNRWQTNFGYNLDKTKKNVLLIETSERFMRENYIDLRMLKYFTNYANRNKNSSGNELLAEDEPEPGFIDLFFNKNINQNLQYNLFNYRVFNPMFESKAALNFYLLGRASGEVVVSKDRKFLLLRETLIPTGARSSYSPLTEDTVTLLINNLNTLYTHYLADGFDEVDFCIIPSPVTLLQPSPDYNGLVTRIQYDPRLKMKMIDIYKIYKEHPERYYAHGDTHWNNEGKLVWIKLVNEILERVHGEGAGAQTPPAQAQVPPPAH